MSATIGKRVVMEPPKWLTFDPDRVGHHNFRILSAVHVSTISVKNFISDYMRLGNSILYISGDKESEWVLPLFYSAAMKYRPLQFRVMNFPDGGFTVCWSDLATELEKYND